MTLVLFYLYIYVLILISKSIKIEHTCLTINNISECHSLRISQIS